MENKPYSISWDNNTARVDYYGEIFPIDIRQAHFDLNAQERFYSCKKLILDVTQCSLSKVDVSELTIVIAADLGASKTIGYMRVAMIADTLVNRAKVSEFISKSQLSPWEFRLFQSAEEAIPWLEE